LRAYALLSGCYFASVGLFNPYAPLWFQSLGFSTLLIGGLSALQSSTRVFAPYAWGWWGDHRGRRVALIRLAAVGTLMCALALLGVRQAWAVAVVTTLLFIANGGIVPLYEATLAQLLNTATGVDPQRYGRVRVWGSVGFILSVTLFGALLEHVGIGVFPAFVAAVNGLMLWAAWRLPVARDETHFDEPAPPVLGLLRQPRVAWFFASVFFTVLAHTSLYAFFSLYLVQLGLGKTAIGALWAVSVAVEIVFFWYQGRWFGRWPALAWLKGVAVATALRFVAVALAGLAFEPGAGGGRWVPLGLAVLVLAQCSHAITFAAHHSACIQLVQHHFPGRLRGRGQALYATLGYGASGVVGGLGGGWLIQQHGYAAVFVAAALAGILAWYCVHRAQRCSA